MAVALANGNLITARLNYQRTGQIDRAMNVLHYNVRELTGAPTNVFTGLQEIAIAIWNHFGPTWANFASNDVQLNNCTVTNVYPLPRSVTVTGADGLPYVGTVSSQPLPLQDAPTILKRTDIGARWGLGRMFVVGTPELYAEGGLIASGGIGPLDAIAGKVDDDVIVVGTGFTCILGPVLVRGAEDNPVSITPIRTAERSNLILKTQRRRRPGKGS